MTALSALTATAAGHVGRQRAHRRRRRGRRAGGLPGRRPHAAARRSTTARSTTATTTSSPTRRCGSSTTTCGAWRSSRRSTGTSGWRGRRATCRSTSASPTRPPRELAGAGPRAARDGARLPALHGAGLPARARARRRHPPLHPHPLAAAGLLARASDRHPHGHPRVDAGLRRDRPAHAALRAVTSSSAASGSSRTPRSTCAAARPRSTAAACASATYPISVDPAEFDRLAAQPEVVRGRAEGAARRGPRSSSSGSTAPTRRRTSSGASRRSTSSSPITRSGRGG